MTKMELNGFQAWVTVGSVELPIYDLQVKEATQEVTGWIPAEAGKEFAVVWKDLNRTKNTRGHVRLDGNHTGSRSIYKKHKHDEVSRSYISVSNTVTRPYLFASVELTDDDTYLNTPYLRKLGEITLTIHHIRKRRDKTNQTREDEIKSWLPQVSKVHERTKKGATHQIRYGEERIRPNTHLAPINDEDEIATIATFRFNYRSLDMLKATGIAPRDLPQPTQLDVPEPEPRTVGKRKAAEVKDEPNEVEGDEEDEDEDVKALQAQLDALKAKRSKTRGNRPKTKKVKIEGHTAIVPGEVIDLT